MTPFQKRIIPITPLNILLRQLRNNSFHRFNHILIKEFIQTRMITDRYDNVDQLNQHHVDEVLSNADVLCVWANPLEAF